MGTMRFLTTIVDEKWYWELEESETFCTEVTAFELVEHLHRRSGGRHVIDAVYIMSDLKQYFYEAASIPVYINMMETVQKKAVHTKLPISNNMLVTISTKSILASVRFPRTTDAWEDKNDVDKTWS